MDNTIKVEGLVKTWEEPIGVTVASFHQGTSHVRTALGWKPAVLLIGTKGERPKHIAEGDVKAMLEEITQLVTGYYFDRADIATIVAKHINITL